MRSVTTLGVPVLLALLLPAASGAQEMTWDWVRSATGNADARSIAVAPSGEVYVVGSYHDELTIDSVTLISNGSADVYVLKLDASGQAIWGRTFGAEWVEYGRAAAVDQAGNIHVGGEFCSNAVAFDSFVLTNTRQTPYPDESTFDVFTAQLDRDGNVLWVEQGGGLYHDHAHDLSIDRSGNVVIFGRFSSYTIRFGPFQLMNSGNIDIFAVKYDNGGTVQWARSAIGTGQENSWAVATDTRDHVYLAGSYRSSTISFDEVTLTNTSDDFDLYVTKLDPAGEALWAVSASGEEWDDAQGLDIDDEDHVYFAGHFDSDSLRFDGATVYLSPSAGTNIDMYLAQIDVDGALEWVTTSEGGAWVYPNALAARSSTGVTTIGTFNGLSAGHPESFGPNTATPVRSYDMFSVQYDVAGGARWCEVLGGSGMDFGQDVEGDESGNVWIAGFFDSDSLQVGSTLLLNDFYNKMLVGKKTPATSTVFHPAIGGRVPSAIIARPNPFTRGVTIRFAVATGEKPELEIYDIAGRLIRRLVGERGVDSRHMAVWDGCDATGRRAPRGIFLVSVRSGEGGTAAKLVKSR